MDNRKKIISALAIGMAVIMLLGLVIGILPQPAKAAPSSSVLQEQLEALKEEKKKIDAQITKLEGQLSDNYEMLEEMVAAKSVIDQSIFMLHQQMANINEQISTYSVMIADKQAELEQAEARLEELNRQNKERIRAMEEDGKLSYWSVLFKANDFSDLLDRLTLVNEIAEADRRRLKEMSQVAETIANAKAELEVERSALQESREEYAAAQVILDEKRAAADLVLSKLIATGEEYEKLLHEAEKNAGKLDSDIDDKEDEYNDAKYQEWLATSIPPTTAPKPSSGGTAGTGNDVGGKTWLVPCNYTRLSSPFGWRIHPIYGDWRFHYGIDLAAASGTPIVATRSGVVVTTTYDSSSGYYVTIDHQDGYASKYLHMTHYIVSVGQKVTAGQVIGYVGSTGASTGPHLHFSILYNGSHVNPANYVKV